MPGRAVVADAIAQCQARHPSMSIVFAETRSLAQGWTYRFLAAAARYEVTLESAPKRGFAWALRQGIEVADRAGCGPTYGPRGG